jgi:hypothetical protein
MASLRTTSCASCAKICFLARTSDQWEVKLPLASSISNQLETITYDALLKQTD